MYTEQFQISKEFNLMFIMNIYIYITNESFLQIHWIYSQTSMHDTMYLHRKQKKENLMYSKMWKMIQRSESWKIFVNEIDTESASLILSTLLK